MVLHCPTAALITLPVSAVVVVLAFLLTVDTQVPGQLTGEQSDKDDEVVTFWVLFLLCLLRTA